MNVHFGRIVYPISSDNNEGAANRLAAHLRHNKGIDTEVVQLNYQHFVLTGKDLTAFRNLQDQYVRMATDAVNKIEADALPKTKGLVGSSMISAGTLRMVGGRQTDWGAMATGHEHFNQDYGITSTASQLEDEMRRVRGAMKKLLREKVQLWFPNDENNLVKGEMYLGPRRGELLDALFSNDKNWSDIREQVGGIARNLSSERYATRQRLSVDA